MNLPLVLLLCHLMNPRRVPFLLSWWMPDLGKVLLLTLDPWAPWVILRVVNPHQVLLTTPRVRIKGWSSAPAWKRLRTFFWFLLLTSTNKPLFKFLLLLNNCSYLLLHKVNCTVGVLFMSCRMNCFLPFFLKETSLLYFLASLTSFLRFLIFSFLDYIKNSFFTLFSWSLATRV